MDMTSKPVVNAIVEKIIEREFKFTYDDIQFINKSENTEVILEEGEEITVKVVGTSTLVNELEKSDLILTLDLSETVPGINKVDLQCVSESVSYTHLDVYKRQENGAAEHVVYPIMDYIESAELDEDSKARMNRSYADTMAQMNSE